jgi:hypothetical protein
MKVEIEGANFSGVFVSNISISLFSKITAVFLFEYNKCMGDTL